MYKNYSKEQKSGSRIQYEPTHQNTTSPSTSPGINEETKRPSTKVESDDEFSSYSFPTIDFCDRSSKGNCDVSNNPRIIDLCQADRQRIALLIKEIARLKEEETAKSKEIKRITSENNDLKAKIAKLEKELSALELNIKYNDDNVKYISKAYANKESNLKSQNLQLQTTIQLLRKENMDLKYKLEEALKQTEKLSNAIYNISMENKLINKKYDHCKEKLKSSSETIKSLEDELKEKQTKSKESKSCQAVIQETKERKVSKECLRKVVDNKFYRSSSSWKKPPQDVYSSDEDSLISELFFIPKQKNHQKTNYFSDEDF